MPWSHTEGKKWLNDEYVRLKPATVVDIGPGAGMYSNWFRPMHRGHWIGVEVWEPYVEAYDLHGKYDSLIIGDAREVDLPEADLYIAGDVLEHMSKDEAVALIERMKAKCKHLFVSVPIIEYHQGALEGNPYETHHYHWDFEEMRDVLLGDGKASVWTWQGEVIGAFHWTKPEEPAPAPKKTTTAARKTTAKK